MDTAGLRQELVSACRILCEKKLVEGFGHVSEAAPDRGITAGRYGTSVEFL